MDNIYKITNHINLIKEENMVNQKGQSEIRILLATIVLLFGLTATIFLTFGIAMGNLFLIGIGELLMAGIPLIVAIIGRYL